MATREIKALFCNQVAQSLEEILKKASGRIRRWNHMKIYEVSDNIMSPQHKIFYGRIFCRFCVFCLDPVTTCILMYIFWQKNIPGCTLIAEAYRMDARFPAFSSIFRQAFSKNLGALIWAEILTVRGVSFVGSEWHTRISNQITRDFR